MAGVSSVRELSHLQRVRLLYKTCLKLHRGLPMHLRAIGDTYVRDEFKRHKEANQEQTQVFMEAWSKYALQLTRQIGLKGPQTSKTLGDSLRVEDLDQFSGEQLAQLFELYQETSKPMTPTDSSVFK
ncbi:hypothetical protein TCAL_05626 [Tigriopus californicus]|uniref:Succinate dehydrogenase assembly factor 3 n=1 Tax=Tigriopus californicus TaxID=6832 RepID=A0A553NVI8_TIGCA|nr:succinate dehydrogenase assembly factor 3, mitochondrial-like [Tigriopus californicus]TRY69445.1 hypothetical protein TCAL_05626 [Tigriopus californicus]